MASRLTLLSVLLVALATCNAHGSIPTAHGSTPTAHGSTPKKAPDVDCVVGDWRPWSQCEFDIMDPFFFNIKLRSRRRPVFRRPRGKGKRCPRIFQVEECLAGETAPVDCEVSQWSGWSYCFRETTSPDAINIRERFRGETVQPHGGGEACPALIETEACEQLTLQTPPISEDCVVAEWQQWSTCFAQTLDTGRAVSARERFRLVTVNQQGEGRPCPVLVETEECELPTPPTPVDCQVSQWTEFSQCRAETIDNGDVIQARERSRRIEVPTENGGAECPVLIETEECELPTPPTPVDCQVSQWTEFSQCRAETIDNGDVIQARERSRRIEVPTENGGAECPVLIETEECAVPTPVPTKAPINCRVSKWWNWSRCYNKRWNGRTLSVRQRKRMVIVPAKDGGQKCPKLVEVQRCPSTNSVDCRVSSWTRFSRCFRQRQRNGKYANVRRRRRWMKISPKGSGKKCPALSETQVCKSTSSPKPSYRRGSSSSDDSSSSNNNNRIIHGSSS